jgi:hypothetical protein
VTVISDGAGEFTKAVDGSDFARGRILDWFHIAMKFRAVEQSILNSRRMEEPHLGPVQPRDQQRQMVGVARQGPQSGSSDASDQRRTGKCPNQEHTAL